MFVLWKSKIILLSVFNLSDEIWIYIWSYHHLYDIHDMVEVYGRGLW